MEPTGIAQAQNDIAPCACFERELYADDARSFADEMQRKSRAIAHSLVVVVLLRVQLAITADGTTTTTFVAA